MSKPDCVIYIPGLGDEPRERLEVPESWKEQYDLDVQLETIEWTKDDYEERLAAIGDFIIRQSDISRMSVMGDSVGGQAALDLFVQYEKYLLYAVTYSTKMESFDFSHIPEVAAANPNLVHASNGIGKNVKKIRPERRQHVLCVHGDRDGTVNPAQSVLKDAEEHAIVLDESIPKKETHPEAIRRGITTEAPVVVNFIEQQAA